MPFTTKYEQFRTEEEAIALAEAAGQHVLTFDVGEVNNDFHWHDFQTTVYLVSGELTVTERDTGQTCTLVAGATLRGDEARQVHREESAGYRIVIGFDEDPSTITRPIDRDPALLS